MSTLAPAAVLGGRYTARRLLGERAGAQSWAGSDGAGGAAVVLHVLPAANPQAPAVLDAARRTAGLDNPRLVRILDAGTDGELVYFVEEAVEGGQTLTQLAGRGGLDSSEVRRLTGEAGLALDAAQRRGLHHLFLNPESVVRLPDGSVKVAGLATEAALAGQDHIGGPRALRRDAQGLVALAYAGLTGRWPHGTETALEPAPRIFGGVPRPSEIAVGVPNDLDTICRQTLSEGLGPSSPGDYASQIAPWPGPSGSPAATNAPDVPEANASDPEAGASAGTAAEMTHAAIEGRAIEGRAIEGRAGENRAGENTGPPEPDASAESDGDAEAVASTIPRSGLPGRAAGWASATAATESLHTAGPPDPSAAPAPLQSEAATGPAGSAAAEPGSGSPGGDDVSEGSPGLPAEAGAGPGNAAAAGPPAASVAGAVGARAGAARTAITGRVGGLARAATSRAGEALSERRSIKAAMREEEDRTRVGLDQTRVESDYEPPAPLLPAEAGAPPSRAQRRVVLALFAVIVAIAGLLGAIGAAKIGSGTDIESILGGSTSRPQTSTGSSTTSAAPGSGKALGIVGASGYDPEGDQAESEDLAPRVYDEDPTTLWQTEGYQAPSFGGLKQGVGLILDMGQVVTPTEATLTLPTSSSLELYVGEEPQREGATKIATVVNRQGVVKVPAEPQASGQYVIVWFTDAPQTSDGRYRATLAEIVLE